MPEIFELAIFSINNKKDCSPMKKFYVAFVCSLYSIVGLAETPVERDAVIYEKFQGNYKFLNALADQIKISGYRCDSLSSARPLLTSRGYKVSCNRFSYDYEIEDKGGNWVVTVK